jgi:hypothetical protein
MSDREWNLTLTVVLFLVLTLVAASCMGRSDARGECREDYNVAECVRLWVPVGDDRAPAHTITIPQVRSTENDTR